MSTSTTSTAILASDFSASTKDFDRDRWTVGKLAVLVEALDGAPVAIICDKQTGFTEVGVTLRAAYRSATAANGRVEVVRPHLVGQEGEVCAYRIDDIGSTIIPLAPTRAKWDALRLYSAVCSAGIAAARPSIEAEGCRYGAYTASLIGAREVAVRYTPQRAPEGVSAGRFTYRHVTVTDEQVGAWRR